MKNNKLTQLEAEKIMDEILSKMDELSAEKEQELINKIKELLQEIDK